MARPALATPDALSAFLSAHPSWRVEDGELRRTFTFETYAACLAFVAAVGAAAERKDHHPEMRISWGKVGVSWSTHDAGGITALDFDLARETDALA